MLPRVEAEARKRLARAFAPRSKGVLQSALRAFARFATATPGRTLFHTPATMRGDVYEMRAWNEWTLILFATYLGITPSRKTGKPVSANSISSYVSMVKGFFSFTYAFTIVAEDPPRLSRFIKLLRSEDPLSGIRRKRRALRRRHLRKAWRMSAAFRADTPNAVNEWAALTTAWHALARGGEICRREGKANPKRKGKGPRTPTRADLSFGRSAGGTRYACVMLRPLKKTQGESIAPVPQYFEEHDGHGSDTFAALERLERLDPVEPGKRAVTPLFRVRRGKKGSPTSMTCGHFRQLVRRVAHGVLRMGKPKQWGGHSARIGGASDLVSTGKASPLLLQAKGRWGSDIGRIYARMTRRAQLSASRLMQKGRGRDLEEILPNFVQGA